MGEKQSEWTLRLASQRDIEVGRNLYAWVNVKTFEVEGGPYPPDEVLTALLQDPAYSDTYFPEPTRLKPGRHGPYWLDKIELQHFVATDMRDVRDRLTAWLQGLEASEDQTQGVLAQIEHLLLDCPTAYRLEDLRPWAHHSYGEMVGRDGFNEFVLISKDSRATTLIVTYDD